MTGIWLLVVWVVVVMAVAFAPRRQAAPLGRFVTPLTPTPRARELLAWPIEAMNVLLTVAANVVFLSMMTPLSVNLWMLDVVMVWNIALPFIGANRLANMRWALPEGAPEKALPLQIKRRRLLMRLAEVICLVANIFIATHWLLAAAGEVRVPVVLALPTLAVTAPIVLAFLVPLRRVQRELSELGAASGLGTRTRGWRLHGMVYFAPDDPALFVPKRLGHTLNLARPTAWVIVLGLLTLVIVLLARGMSS